jgi:hypothetical protein
MTRLIHHGNNEPDQPEFMGKLGLLPPYSEEDVKQAYLEKVKTAHPDKGGSAAGFHEIQLAYERALDHVRFRSDRRGWIAYQMDAYVNLQNVLDTLMHQFGADVECEMSDWMQASFGEFAQLTDRVVSIRLHDSPRADELIHMMIRQQESLRYLRELDLAGCQISDEAVLALHVFTRLRDLNLNRTPITSRALKVVSQLPNLETIELDGTSIGWWSRRIILPRLRKHARRRASTDALSIAVRDRMRRPD